MSYHELSMYGYSSSSVSFSVRPENPFLRPYPRAPRAQTPSSPTVATRSPHALPFPGGALTVATTTSCCPRSGEVLSVSPRWEGNRAARLLPNPTQPSIFTRRQLGLRQRLVNSATDTSSPRRVPGGRRRRQRQVR